MGLADRRLALVERDAVGHHRPEGDEPGLLVLRQPSVEVPDRPGDLVVGLEHLDQVVLAGPLLGVAELLEPPDFQQAEARLLLERADHGRPEHQAIRLDHQPAGQVVGHRGAVERPDLLGRDAHDVRDQQHLLGRVEPECCHGLEVEGLEGLLDLPAALVGRQVGVEDCHAACVHRAHPFVG